MPGTKSVAADHLSDLLLYRDNRLLFVQEKLGLDITSEPRFAQAIASEAKDQLWLWSRQVGKTTAAAALLTHEALYKPGSLCLIASASERQAKILQGNVTRFIRRLGRSEKWREIPGREGMIPVDIGDPTMVKCSTLSLELRNESQVISVPATPDTVRGYSPQRIVLDEAAWTADEVYYAITPSRSRTGAKLLVMSTAGAMQGFFYKAWVEEKGWEKIEIRADDCPWIPKDFLEKERERMPEPFYKREYQNTFLEPAGSLIPQALIDAARAAGRDLPSFFERIGDRDPSIKPFLGGEQ